VISHPAYAAEPWAVRETNLDLGVLDQAGSVFALSNGHIGLRGNLDESEPQGLPGSYLNGFYEERELPYAEAGYGYPEAGQTAVNVTNGKIIRLLVDDEPFDVRSGTLRSHERVLDFRAGVLRRTADWVSPAGQQVRVSSVRLVSLVQRAVAAVLYEVEPIDAPARLVIQSELVANEQMPRAAADPRAAPQLGGVLRSEQFSHRDARAVLVHITRKSALRIAAGMDHLVDGPPGTETATESSEDLGRLTIMADLKPGERLRMVKFVAYGWSSRRSTPALRDQVAAALSEARRVGWEGLLADQRGYLDDFWERADVELEGDTELQQAVRFALFHTLQAGARSERRAIAAKGLTGPGYDGHAFWDLRLARPDLHRAARRPRCAALAPRDAECGSRPGQASGVRGRDVPLADD
jgi:alpha,alpha-trehalose phosphorylase